MKLLHVRFYMIVVDKCLNAWVRFIQQLQIRAGLSIIELE